MAIAQRLSVCDVCVCACVGASPFGDDLELCTRRKELRKSSTHFFSKVPYSTK